MGASACKRNVEQSLHGKTAVIIGASKGLGKAMAWALGSAGANIFLVSRDLEQPFSKLRLSAFRHRQNTRILLNSLP